MAVVVGLTLLAPPLLAQASGPERAPGVPGDLTSALEDIRRSTEKYRDVQTALADGYVPDPMNVCVSAALEGYPSQLGGMGIHYFRPDLLGITGVQPRVAGTGIHTDFTQPGVLVYFPTEDGELELGAVENLVFREGWAAAGHTDPSSFHGRQYWRMVDNPATDDVDEAHMFEPHYELHLWVHAENPMGPFFPFNPNVSCEQQDGPKTMEEGLRWMQEHAPKGTGEEGISPGEN